MALRLVDTYRVLDRTGVEQANREDQDEANRLTARAIIADMEEVGRERPFLYLGDESAEQLIGFGPLTVKQLERSQEIREQAEWLRQYDHAHTLKPSSNVSHRKRSWWPLVALGVIVVGMAIVFWGMR